MGTVQFIAYQLQTAAEGDTARAKYPGLKDQERDLELRAKVMVDAIEAAAGSSKINSMAQKVFVAPEFFFRGGEDGVYQVETISKLNEIFDEYLADKRYAKWTFVLGTALGVLPEQGGKKEILNLAIVREGGSKVGSGGSGKSLLIYKEYISAIDFMGPNFDNVDDFMGNAKTAGKANVEGAEATLMPTSGAKGLGLVEHIDVPNLHGADHTYTPSKAFREALVKLNTAKKVSDEDMKRWLTPQNYTTSESSKTGLGGGTNFSIGGLDFVLEICLDHLQRRAKGSVTAGVDAHVVTSCGMAPKYALVKEKGCLFLVDGIEHSKKCVHLLQRRPGPKLKRIEPDVSIKMTEKARWKKHPSKATNLFQAGRGTVYVFPKVTID